MIICQSKEHFFCYHSSFSIWETEKVKLTLAVLPRTITDFNKHSWAENVRTKNLLIGTPLSCKNVEYQWESLPLAPNLTPYNRLGRCIFDSNAFLLHWHSKHFSLSHGKCRVVLLVDQATGSTYLHQADRATRSSYLWAYISYVHCTSVCQPLSCHPEMNKLLDTSLCLLHYLTVR